MRPYRDRFGVWNVEGKPKPRNEEFWAAVEAKVKASAGVDGWRNGPLFITDNAADEQIDTPAWLTGLDLYPFPPGAKELRAEIGEDAADLFEKIQRLKGMYAPRL